MEWISTERAAAELGLSVRTLYRLRRAGVLLAGVHWLTTGTGPRAAVRYNTVACLMRLRVLSLARV